MERYFDPAHRRVVYIGARSDRAYWDRHWQGQEARGRQPSRLSLGDRLVLDTTRRHLPPRSRILEGGCGPGGKLLLLDRDYRTCGVDYATRTVRRVRLRAPGLELAVADVRRLPFCGDSFDGYWSLGVIEHFYAGYDAILEEMWRVLRPGGVLFVTFPSLSRARRVKARLGLFARYHARSDLVAGFYQFALDPRGVRDTFVRRGFRLRERRDFNGVAGLAEEARFLSLPLKVLSRLAQRPTDWVLSPWFNHMTLLVFEKPPGRPA